MEICEDAGRGVVLYAVIGDRCDEIGGRLLVRASVSHLDLQGADKTYRVQV